MSATSANEDQQARQAERSAIRGPYGCDVVFTVGIGWSYAGCPWLVIHHRPNGDALHIADDWQQMIEAINAVPKRWRRVTASGAGKTYRSLRTR